MKYMSSEYLQVFNQKHIQKVLKDLRVQAKSDKIPIIEEEGMLYLRQIITMTRAKHILEIGTAIGYSAISMALIDSTIKIDTIEKNEPLYQVALQNIKNAKCENQIRVFCDDALIFDTKQLGKTYDLIFIDAAKAQYGKFFEKYEVLLKQNGYIVVDNLLFHGLIASKHPIESKNLRALVEKIRKFNIWLAKNKKYETIFFNIGDGMAVSKKI